MVEIDEHDHPVSAATPASAMKPIATATLTAGGQSNSGINPTRPEILAAPYGIARFQR